MNKPTPAHTGQLVPLDLNDLHHAPSQASKGDSVMTNVENLSCKYGKVSFDNKIGNVKKRLKTGHPDKRYFTLTADTGEKVYWLNLIEARYAIKQDPEAYREITTEDVDAEVATRGTRGPRINGGKWAEVLSSNDDCLTISFNGEVFTFSKRAEKQREDDQVEKIELMDWLNDVEPCAGVLS